MKKIASFEVDHTKLTQGIYISRIDTYGKNIITTFDIRCVRPNYGDVLPIDAMHTIEHIGATYFRNHPTWKNKIIYFGPMGCQTGFYLILKGSYPLYGTAHKSVIDFIIDMFRFIVKFSGPIPGASAIECGNYKSHNLETAKMIAANMLVMHDDLCILGYEYQTDDEEENKAIHLREEMYINIKQDRKNAAEAKSRGVIVKQSKTYLNPVVRDYECDDTSVLEILSDEEKARRKKNIDSSIPLF